MVVFGVQGLGQCAVSKCNEEVLRFLDLKTHDISPAVERRSGAVQNLKINPTYSYVALYKICIPFEGASIFSPYFLRLFVVQVLSTTTTPTASSS